MSDTKVQIDLITKADLKGLQEVTRAQDPLQKELKETTAANKELTSVQDPLEKQLESTRAALGKLRASLSDVSDEQEKATEATAKLNPEVETLGKRQEDASSKSKDLGAALLEMAVKMAGSQSNLDELLAGVKDLSVALGAGAGLGGVLVLVVHGLELLISNLDKLFAATQNKPDWTQLTPEEEQVKRMEDYNRSLERQVELLERIETARRGAIAAQQAEDDAMEKRKALWADLVPDASGDLPPLPGTEGPSAESRKLGRNVETARETTAQAVAAAVLADEEYKARQKVVQDTEKRLLLEKQFQEAQGADRVKLGSLQAADSEGGIAAFSEEIAALQAAMAKREAEFKQATSGLSRMDLARPLTGDTAKDEETLRESLQRERAALVEAEQRRNQAAVSAQATYGPLNAAEQAFNAQRGFEGEQRAAEGFKGLGLPPPPGVISGADAQAGFDLSKPSQDAAAIQEIQSRVSSQLGEVTGLQAQIASAFEAAISSFAQTLQGIQRTAESAAQTAQQARDSVRPNN